MYFATIAFVIIICLVLGFIEIKRKQFSNSLKDVYGPVEYPLIGNLLTTMKMNHLTSLNQFVNDVICQPTTKLITGPLGFVFTYDADIVQQVLSSNVFLERPFLFEFFHMNHGVLMAEYKIWKPLRRSLNVALNKLNVQPMKDVFKKHIEELCKMIAEHEGKGTIDIKPILTRKSIEQTFETLLDSEYHATDEDNQYFTDLVEAVPKRMINPFYYLEPIYQCSEAYRIEMKGHEYFDKKIIKAIEKKQKELEYVSEGDMKTTFIERLMVMKPYGKRLSFKEISDNIKTIIFGGYETSALTVAYTVLMMAMHPEVDQKLYEEICEYCGTSRGKDFDYLTVLKMPYLDMVVKEVLRLFPAVPIGIRQNLTPTNVENIGHIPKGTNFIVCLYKMHRNQEYYGPDADKFNPENFTQEKIAARNPYCYMPFSSGIRNCIGVHYANLNVRMVLVELLTKFRFTTNLKYEDLTTTFGLTLNLDQKHLVQVHKRTSA